MTIDDLARMVQNGFTSVDKRFDDVNKRFDDVYERIVSVDNKVDSLDNKVDSLERKLDTFQLEVKEEFVLANEQIRSLNFAVEINDLRSRMRRVEQKIGL